MLWAELIEVRSRQNGGSVVKAASSQLKITLGQAKVLLMRKSDCTHYFERFLIKLLDNIARATHLHVT